jgi:hypothetical protein
VDGLAEKAAAGGVIVTIRHGDLAWLRRLELERSSGVHRARGCTRHAPATRRRARHHRRRSGRGGRGPTVATAARAARTSSTAAADERPTRGAGVHAHVTARRATLEGVASSVRLAHEGGTLRASSLPAGAVRVLGVPCCIAPRCRQGDSRCPAPTARAQRQRGRRAGVDGLPLTVHAARSRRRPAARHARHSLEPSGLR